MMHRAWRYIEVVPIVFQGRPLNFKITRDKKSPILTRIEGFRTVIHVLIHPWISNYAESLMWYRSGVLLFFKVLHHISRSDGTKHCWFDPNWAFSDCKLKFEFTDGFQMMYKVTCSIEKVPYCFWRSSIKFRGHMGWQIDDVNPIWVRLLGRSQVSNPSDLRCFYRSTYFIRNSTFKITRHFYMGMFRIEIQIAVYSLTKRRILYTLYYKSCWLQKGT